jgi:isoleucyl-tRNA synthetase
VRTRQPLGRALVGASGWASLPEELRGQIADELNVQGFDTLASIGGDLVEYVVKPNFRELGKRFGKQTPQVAKAITSAEPAALTHALRDTGTATVEAAEVGKVELAPGDVIVTERPRSGWAVESAAGETVGLDLTVTPELRRAGLVREVIRLVQDARKNTGLEITDRIELWWRTTDADLDEALAEHGSEVASEVLADAWHDDEPEKDLPANHDEDLRLTFWLRRSSS